MVSSAYLRRTLLSFTTTYCSCVVMEVKTESKLIDSTSSLMLMRVMYDL